MLPVIFYDIICLNLLPIILRYHMFRYDLTAAGANNVTTHSKWLNCFLINNADINKPYDKD